MADGPKTFLCHASPLCCGGGSRGSMFRSIADIIRRRLFDPQPLFLGDRSLDAPRPSQDQASRRDHGVFGDQGTGPDDALFAYDHPVHQDRPHADQDPVLDGAAMQHDVMTDRHLIADDQRMRIVSDVQDAEILNVRPVSDLDEVHVSADDAQKPDTRLRTDDYIADHDCRLLYERVFPDLRQNSLKGAQHRFLWCTLGQPIFENQSGYWMPVVTSHIIAYANASSSASLSPLCDHGRGHRLLDCDQRRG